MTNQSSLANQGQSQSRREGTNSSWVTALLYCSITGAALIFGGVLFINYLENTSFVTSDLDEYIACAAEEALGKQPYHSCFYSGDEQVGPIMAPYQLLEETS